MNGRQAASRAEGDGSILYVVPTLGRRASYLTGTLDSLQGQDHAHLTVVVVAPPDADHVREEAVRRGVLFIAQSAPGLSAAINAGWRAFGHDHEFWAWLGDDDSLTPGSAGLVTRYLQDHPAAAMVYGRCTYVDEFGTPLHDVRPTAIASWLMRWGPNLVPQPGSVARAAAVRRAGWLDENLRYAMDLDLFLRLQDVGPVRYLPAVLATFRWHAASTTVASAAESDAEARLVRARTWTGRRAVGRFVEPLATIAGRLLNKVQRAPHRPLHLAQ